MVFQIVVENDWKKGTVSFGHLSCSWVTELFATCTGGILFGRIYTLLGRVLLDVFHVLPVLVELSKCKCLSFLSFDLKSWILLNHEVWFSPKSFRILAALVDWFWKKTRPNGLSILSSPNCTKNCTGNHSFWANLYRYAVGYPYAHII